MVLVAETPIRGVQPKMLQQGLDLAARVWTARLKAENNAPAAGPVARIIGPNFSGSSSSIVRTVRSWLEARKRDLQPKVAPNTFVISWINGQALSLNPKLFDESFSDIWPRAVQFQSVAYGSRNLNFLLFNYLANHCTPLKGGDRIAYLTEETTGFGNRVVESIRLTESKGFDLQLKSSLNDVSGIPREGKNLIIVAAVNHVLHFRIFDGDGKEVVDTDEKRLTEQARQIENLRKQLENLWPPHELPENEKDEVITAVTSIVGPTFKVFVYSFPAHISEIRRRYARQTAATPQQGVTLKSAEQLGFAYDEGADTPEMIPIESPGVMAANDEMRLLRIAQDIHRRGIRFAWVMATDMRDLLFVADYLQTHCPNTQLVSLSTEEAFTHHEQISKLRGMLFATTYPLWMKNQDAEWTVPDQKTARSELRLLVVPNHASLMTYNATLGAPDRAGAGEPAPRGSAARPDRLRLAGRLAANDSPDLDHSGRPAGLLSHRRSGAAVATAS